MEIIIHKGVLDYLPNSIISVLTTLSLGYFCEVDIMYNNGVWMMAHDFGALHIRSNKFTDLIEILLQNPNLLKNNLLIDVKWDMVFNDNDDPCVAALLLKEQVRDLYETNKLLIQAPDIILCYMYNEPVRLGKIIYSIEEISSLLSFVTMNLSSFSIEEINSIPTDYSIIGYTCNNINNLNCYQKYSNLIDAIVCDVFINELKDYEKKK